MNCAVSSKTRPSSNQCVPKMLRMHTRRRRDRRITELIVGSKFARVSHNQHFQWLRGSVSAKPHSTQVAHAYHTQNKIAMRPGKIRVELIHMFLQGTHVFAIAVFPMLGPMAAVSLGLCLIFAVNSPSQGPVRGQQALAFALDLTKAQRTRQPQQCKRFRSLTWGSRRGSPYYPGGWMRCWVVQVRPVVVPVVLTCFPGWCRFALWYARRWSGTPRLS